MSRHRATSEQAMLVAVTYLVALLDNSVRDVRRATVAALAKLQATFASERLQRLLQDSDSEVVKAARRALVTLSSCQRAAPCG